MLFKSCAVRILYGQQMHLILINEYICKNVLAYIRTIPKCYTFNQNALS